MSEPSMFQGHETFSTDFDPEYWGIFTTTINFDSTDGVIRSSSLGISQRDDSFISLVYNPNMAEITKNTKITTSEYQKDVTNTYTRQHSDGTFTIYFLHATKIENNEVLEAESIAKLDLPNLSSLKEHHRILGEDIKRHELR